MHYNAGSDSKLFFNVKLSKKHDYITPALDGRTVNIKLSPMVRELSLWQRILHVKQIMDQNPANAVRGFRIWNVIMVRMQSSIFKLAVCLTAHTERSTLFVETTD
jgi:hypothetical protein